MATLAVFRPTPGRVCRTARSRGTALLCSLIQDLRQLDDILGFGVIEADRLHMLFEPGFAEFQHFFRRVGDLEQFCRGFVDADIGRLGGEHHGHQQGIGG